MSIQIPGYQISEALFKSESTIIYRAICEKSKVSVIIKTLNSDYPSSNAIAHLKHEFYMLKKLEGCGIIHVYEQIKYGNNLALILEDINGCSLQQFLNQKTKFELGQFLHLAIQISKSMGNIHGQDIIHKNINPSHIVFNDNRVQVIDFGIATELSREKQNVNASSQFEASIAYLSPEQTGRMNRDLDYRSDYYSLGVTFYQMLTGSLPFYAEDTLEWIHCHIAKIPLSPHQLDGSIPPVLSEIVMKLLSKNAEDRYQSLNGLIHDLEICASAFQQNGNIEYFDIGQQDISQIFQIPQKLFGRQNELKTLMDAFDRTAAGKSQCLLISGYSGVGKSALVHEVHKPIVHQKGYFIDGKFDPFQQNIPYSSLIQTFRGLVNQLLAETDERLKQWEMHILNAIHPNGQLIIDLIPELERIIGKQKAVQELGPSESQNRFLMTFKNFIQVFARKAHPLVLFLDDLQWSDIPTLKLIEHLLHSGDMSYFLLIGAFRSNEVTIEHPLQNVLDDLEQSVSMDRVVLKPLNIFDVNKLLAETLHCDLKATAQLSILISHKTQGNPFFVNVLLKNLYQERLFNFVDNHWDWDLATISQMDITDNVVEFMIRRLEVFEQETQETLQLAACLGSSFDLRALAMVQKQSLAIISQHLHSAIQEGIIVPTNTRYRLVHLQESEKEELDFGVSYRFQHDKVRQAAYSMLEKIDKKQLHLRIARFLLKSTPENDIDSNVIDMVSHFNEAIDLIEDPQELEHIVLLNLRAGKKAKRSTAYQPAFEYLTTAKCFLPRNAWEVSYQHCFDIFQEYADVAYLIGELDLAELAVKILLDRSKTKMERVSIYSMQVVQYNLVGRLEDAVDTGLKALSLLGIDLSVKPNKFIVAKEALKVKWSLGKRSIAGLIEQALMENPEKRMAMRILIELIPPSYILGLENLFAMIVLKHVNIALRFGNSPEAAHAYIVYAMLLNGAFVDLKHAQAFGELAIKLNEKLNDLEFRCRIIFLYTTFVHCWNHHWNTSFLYYKQAIEVGYQTGDLHHIGFASFFMPNWNVDLSLGKAIELANRNLVIARSLKHQDAIEQGSVIQQYRFNLIGKTNDDFSLSDGMFDEKKSLEKMFERKAFTPIAMYFLVKLQVYYIHDASAEGVKLIPRADKVIKSLMGMPFTMEYCFFVFMTFSALYPEMGPKEKRLSLRRMKKEYKRMRKWHEHYAVNSLHLILMMDAELARIHAAPQKAIAVLKKAIEAAGKNGFLKYKALANELMGKLYITQNELKIGNVYLSDAMYDYEVWGAAGKVDFLKKSYPELTLSSPVQGFGSQKDASSWGNVEGAPKTNLDLSSIIKASRALSKEISLEALLIKMIRLVVQNAGASRGVLLLENDNQWFVEAEWDEREASPTVLQSIAEEAFADMAHSIVRYVIHTGESAILADASNQGPFSRDPYIGERQLKSVLCAPLLNQGKMIAILYLENNFASDAFTQDRVTILQLLSAQASVSIENAKVYERLEERVKERTTELEKTHQQLLETAHRAGMSEVAVSILHDVGNILNSVNVSAFSIQESLEASDIYRALSLVVNAFDSHKSNLQHFLTEDVKGKQIPQYLQHIQQGLGEQEQQMKALIERLLNKIEHITQIIQLQQDYVGDSVFKDLQSIQKLINDAVQMQYSDCQLHGIEIHCEKDNGPPMMLSKHKVLGILVNLIKNAKESIVAQNPESKRIDIRVIRDKSKFVQIELKDNGLGISPEDKKRIFQQGFTTKTKGHGLGLHGSINAAKEFSGNLTFDSEGLGKGAVFILEIPLEDSPSALE